MNELLTERSKTHGDFKDTARAAQRMKEFFKENEFTDPDLSYVQAEALDMICTKLARIVSGNPDEIDTWVDIAGYAQLVVNDLEAKPSTED
ncbi:MAG: hypothetical protein KAI73_07665 [Rhodospirillaceae bacterium]|nr:hypothetical protein [Rhodospirillaceae bacterium]